MAEEELQVFGAKTTQWFRQQLGAPTAVQKEAWPAIAAGGHVLVAAPTGTGKTLSAFLVFLDRLKALAEAGSIKQQLYVIYVSPLKSLAADIRENLKKPLVGIGAEEEIRVGIRTGDTTQKERRQMIQKPPHILIITPESLYLMLTSKTGQNVLCTAQAIIIDELHALIDTKRGAHLMLSVARLDILCKHPLQRIGLSATIAPLSMAAQYLAPESVFVAAPPMKKAVRLQTLGSYVDNRKRKKDPVWQELSALVYQYCEGNRSVIAFVEGRRYAEKLAYYVNLLGGQDFARVHHGSLSKEQRYEVEQSLREGRLRLLCATSSMELGIDVGEIDQVLQIGCPRTISGTMQRLGRAGHNPFRTSVMYLFPRTAAESVLCGMTAHLATEGKVEPMSPPEGCLDVLAQHLVSMAAFRSYTVGEVMEILPRAWSFRKVSQADVQSVLEMLAGDYEHKKDVPVRPRILYDRIHGIVEGDSYSRMLAISAGGTIPDKGLYTVRTQEGVKVGEVDEEFVYETQKGDRFILGAFAWKVVNIGRDTVTVSQAPVEGARLPFWKGELKGRNKETAVLFGQILRGLQKAAEDGDLEKSLALLGLDAAASRLAGAYLKRQIAATGTLPDDKTIIAEHFRDQSGNSQLMIHSIFGRRINAPLALLAAYTAREETEMNVGSVDEEDGFLLYAYGDRSIPEGVLGRIVPETAEGILSALLPATPLFNMAFRYNCGRALMMGVRTNGRHPLWMQRLRSSELLDQVVREKEHPLIRETRQECMNHLWDVEGVRELLEKIQLGLVVVHEIYTQTPSPMSLPLQWEQEAAVMYDYAPTPRGVHAAVEEALKQEKELLRPGATELSWAQKRTKLPEDEKQLHTLLMTEGDLVAGELEIPIEWLESLARKERAVYLEQGLWIAAEQQQEYITALEEHEFSEKALHIVRRMLRYRGASTICQTALRYGWQKEKAKVILEELCRRDEAVPQQEQGVTYYYHAQLYQRARTKTIRNRREAVSTCASSAYAALLLSRIQRTALQEECIKNALDSLSGTAFLATAWEDFILPSRVKNYRENLLDNLLSAGEYVWHMEEGGKICFDRTSQIDWESEPVISDETLSNQEQVLVHALSKRGASFLQALDGMLQGVSLYDTILLLIEKGIVNSDSFIPVRQWANKEKTKKSVTKQRISAQVKMLHAGRYDLVRPLRASTIQEQMDKCFDRYCILCRETAAIYGLSWQEALSILRVQEYTGQVQRGYFVEGLSGAQFIRRQDYGSVTTALARPQQEWIWINASDPMQPWGKLLPHEGNRAFVNVSGTVVALRGGLPMMLFERQGKVLRIFDTEGSEYALRLFVQEYRAKRIYSAKKRIVVKDYPSEIDKTLSAAGFDREMQDYVLYR